MQSESHGVHLADQLLIPMAMAGGGAFHTRRPGRHTTTNAEVVWRFLDVTIDIVQDEDGRSLIQVS